MQLFDQLSDTERSTPSSRGVWPKSPAHMCIPSTNRVKKMPILGGQLVLMMTAVQTFVITFYSFFFGLLSANNHAVLLASHPFAVCTAMIPLSGSFVGFELIDCRRKWRGMAASQENGMQRRLQLIPYCSSPKRHQKMANRRSSIDMSTED